MNSGKINIFKSFFIVVLFLYAFSQIAFSKTNDKTKKVSYSAGFYKSVFEDIPPNDAIAAYTVWIREIEKNANLDFSLNLKLYNDINDMLKNYRKDKLVIAIFTTIDYLAQSDTNNFKPIFAPSINKKPGSIYYILSKKNKFFKNIFDLENSKLGITTSYLHNASVMWLDVLLHENKLPQKDKFFRKIIRNNKDSKNILDVFFGKLDACVVPQVSYDLMIELNPQIGQQLKILVTSPLYTNGIVCFTSILKDQKAYNKLKEKISFIGNYESGQQMLRLIKINNIMPLKKEYFDSFIQLLKDYNRINEK